MPYGITLTKMTKLFRRLAADTAGASLIEYGLIVSLLAVAIIISLSAMGDSLEQVMEFTSTSMDSTTP